jgi:hypothetical protein
MVYSEATGVDLDKLTNIVTADTYIVNAREPQISSSGQPSPLTSLPRETPPADTPKIPEPRKTANSKTDRANLPYALFTELAAGQKLKGAVEYVRLRKDNGQPSFALVRVTPPGLSGMLHSSQMITGFSPEVGHEIELFVRQVDAEKREVYFSQQSNRLPAHDLMAMLEGGKAISPSGIAALLGSNVSAEAAIKAAATSLLLQTKTLGTAGADTSLDRSTAIDTYNRLVQEFSLLDTPFIPSPEPIKGLTYGEIARELGYELADVVNAAGHMIGDTDTYQLGVAVLPAGFTPTEASAFPAEHKEAFIRECRERADKGWSKQLDLEVALKPDCLSLAHLAKHMGISEAELLTLMTEKGIQPKVQVVLTSEDIKALGQ